MKRTTLILSLLLLSMLLLCSCTAIPDSQVDIDSVKNRLEQIDAYKETIPTSAPVADLPSSASSFRGIPYGATMSQVADAETLEFVEDYSNALDYAATEVFSYDMLTTYWFNEAGQFYSGSYYLLSDTFLPTLQNIEAGLAADYGQPTDAAYRDLDNNIVTFESDAEGQAALDNQEAVYYLGFYDDATGLVVEVYAEGGDSGGYQFNIYYTDPTYMD